MKTLLLNAACVIAAIPALAQTPPAPSQPFYDEFGADPLASDFAAPAPSPYGPLDPFPADPVPADPFPADPVPADPVLPSRFEEDRGRYDNRVETDFGDAGFENGRGTCWPSGHGDGLERRPTAPRGRGPGRRDEPGGWHGPNDGHPSDRGLPADREARRERPAFPNQRATTGDDFGTFDDAPARPGRSFNRAPDAGRRFEADRSVDMDRRSDRNEPRPRGGATGSARRPTR